LERTRIVLVGMPRMLREIVSGVVSMQPDLAVVAVTGRARARQVLAKSRADVAVTGLDESARQGALDLLGTLPRLRVVAISPDGREGTLYELRSHEVCFGELSPELLLAAIRGRIRGRNQS
jgi:hypothetical protein